jgi:hypothetical protein
MAEEKPENKNPKACAREHAEAARKAKTRGILSSRRIHTKSGRAGLLARTFPPAFPSPWRQWLKIWAENTRVLTVAGTAPDLHRFPFSFKPLPKGSKPFPVQIRTGQQGKPN